MPRYGKVTRGFKVSLRTVCKLGTIAHNKDFSRNDFTEYTRASSTQLAALMKRGIVKHVRAGRFYPTARGWNVIERACSMMRRQ